MRISAARAGADLVIAPKRPQYCDNKNTAAFYHLYECTTPPKTLISSHVNSDTVISYLMLCCDKNHTKMM